MCLEFSDDLDFDPNEWEYYSDEYEHYYPGDDDDSEPIECPECGLTFTTWNHLDNHDCEAYSEGTTDLVAPPF